MQNHQADSPLYVWPDVWSADLHLLIKSMIIHDTECPYWDQVSLNNTNQTKPNVSQPATPGYCSFLSITNIQGSNYLLIEYKIGLEMLATKKNQNDVYL